MYLSPIDARILLALGAGWTLKSHRYLDGTKTYKLHSLDGTPPETVAREHVNGLYNAGLIDSNKKFPAATYLLTAKGQRVYHTLTGSNGQPLTAIGWQSEM
jgi:hypothetical protein